MKRGLPGNSGLESLIMACACCVAFVAVSLLAAPAIPSREVDTPTVTANQDAERVVGRIKAPAGFKLELVAAEPLLANPVAFCFDERGRIYVAETHRVGSGNGVEDNRGHMEWLDDDLAAQTVEDRVAYIKKHLGPQAEAYTKFSERIKLLEDTDGDGRMDASRVFADGFNGIADGAGAGVLAHRGDVFYTCIPNLWKLRDTDGDGHANERKSLHYGYGVRFAFYGHDLHGLTIGPDGRLYFSIGDRGLNVTTAEGRKVVNVDSGAVMRCELDGSNLEVFCRGLRNPQELAFDDYGNLFTCDNNSDAGDEARWTYLVEGADYGWRMHYQYLPDRGPWNREKLWHPQHESQPAYIVPCIANITDGPSGITYYPGTGLGDDYKGHFFVCDFRGGAANSCIHTWSQQPKGASYELVGSRKFLEGILVTDCDFGPSGGLYASDWIDGWSGTGRGRIYRVVPDRVNDPRVAEVKKLLAEGFDQRTTDELVKLLSHIDRRVRQGAQFALAERKAVEPLSEVAKNGKQLLARLHAVWALGQVARSEPSIRPVIDGQITTLLRDAPNEVQAQVIRVFGDSPALPLAALEHDDPHTRHLAALAIKGGETDHARALVELLRRNSDQDPVIRHSAALGLSRLENKSVLEEFAKDESPAVRMGVLLAWRHLAEPSIARFLNDSEPRLVLEAARAIHDVPIEGALEKLALRIDKPFTGSANEYDALFRRVLNANFRLGKAEHAAALAKYAGRDDVPEHLRVEAIAMLGDWVKPSPRDRVLGNWRPLAARDANIAAEALQKELAAVFRGPSQVRRAAGSVAAKLEIREVVPELRQIVNDNSNDVVTRVAALEAIAALKGHRLDEVVGAALTDREPVLRNAARKVLAAARPAEAVKPLEAALKSGETIEKQAALNTLSTLDDGKADELLVAWLDKLAAGDVPPEMGLDIVLAAQVRLDAKKSANADNLRERLAKVAPSRDATDAAYFRLCLVGGDAQRGKDIFFKKIAVSCLRCHKVRDNGGNVNGGDVGPDLTKLGGEKTREYLLEALVEPNKAIAKGYETVIVTLDDGREHVGIVKAETDDELVLVTADVKTITVDKKSIQERSTGPSAMPSDLLKHLTLQELRDLIEFLASQKGESK